MRCPTARREDILLTIHRQVIAGFHRDDLSRDARIVAVPFDQSLGTIRCGHAADRESGTAELWDGQTLDVLYDRIRTTMPPKEPGTYGHQMIADVVAYVLKVNGFPAGAVELPKDAGALKEIRMMATKP